MQDTSEVAQSANRRIGGDTDQPRQAAVQWAERYGQWTTLYMKGEARAGLATVETQLREAEALRLPAMIADAHRRLGVNLALCGRFTEGRLQAELARGLYNELWAAEFRATTAMDFVAAVEIALAVLVWITGDILLAKSHLEAALAKSETSDAFYAGILLGAGTMELLAVT